MKIIEALKQIKDLQRKASDLRDKIQTYCAYQNVETPTYGERQTAQITDWLQAHSDIIRAILELRTAVQRTNIQTTVTIAIGGKNVTHSIAAWIHRRRDLADLERQAWQGLSNKGLREGMAKNTAGELIEVKTIRCYDPVERDTKVELYRSEPTLIDSQLEITNAITDLITE